MLMRFLGGGIGHLVLQGLVNIADVLEAILGEDPSIPGKTESEDEEMEAAGDAIDGDESSDEEDEDEDEDMEEIDSEDELFADESDEEAPEDREAGAEGEEA